MILHAYVYISAGGGVVLGFIDWLLGEPSETQKRSDTPPPSDPSTVHNVPSRATSPLARPVTAGEGLTLSNVYRAVQILSTSVSQMSLDAYRGDDLLDPAPGFIKRPDIDSTRSAFLEMTTVSLATNGNAYWRIFRDSQGRVTNLTVLNPNDVTIQTSTSGRVTGYSDQGHDLAPEDVRHLALMRVPGTPYGLGPIQSAQQELRGALDLRNYAVSWFESSGHAPAILSTDQHLTPENAMEYKERWMFDRAAGHVAVMGAGLKYSPVILNPADAQFIENQAFTVTQLARLFGIPASLMLAAVEGNSQSYSNVEQDWLAFYRFTLTAYTREIETALSELLPRGQDARFNFEALLRADTTTRYAAHNVALKAGFLSIDEVRAIEKLPPLPNGLGKFKKPEPVPAPLAAAEEKPAPGEDAPAPDKEAPNV